ncbi:MAG: hypothetical protein WC428_02020 [Candidatus Paceibacterota bacterium]|jgi:hypothetical protein
MKNFNELKEKIKKEEEKIKDKTFALTQKEIIINQAQIYSDVNCILILLEKMAKQLNIEIKDDDGNIISIDDYCDLIKKDMFYTFWECHEK